MCGDCILGVMTGGLEEKKGTLHGFNLKVIK